MTRTFLALDLDEGVRRRLLEAARAIESPGQRINWVAQEQIHITLMFLGDVPDAVLNEVCGLTAQAAGGFGEFDFEVRGLSAAPPRGPVRMIWANVRDAGGELSALHTDLTSALAGLNLRQEERAFVPHVTLARVKYAPDPSAIRRTLAPLADEPFGVIRAGEVVAYASQLTREGPIHGVIARAPFAGAAR